MRIVSETPAIDLSGDTLFPQRSSFDTIRTSDSYLASSLTEGRVTGAFMQLGTGEFYDVDTFSMRLDAGDSYRIVFSSAETGYFLSNRGMTLYDAEGGYLGLILNDFGDTFGAGGTLNSATFTAGQSGDYFLFSEFANRGGNVVAGYGLTLEKVADVTPWDIAFARNGMGAKAVITAGDETIPAGRQVDISITFATANLSFDDIRLLVNGSYSSSTSATTNSTTIYLSLASTQALTLRDLVEVRFTGGAVAGTLEVSSVNITVAGSPAVVDIDPRFTTPGNKVLAGTSGNDRLSGDIGNDLLLGHAGNDSLNGGAGNDTLNGGLGADHMTGGTGNDIYWVDNAADLVVERANQGTDLVRSSINHTLAANVENLELTGTAALSGNGNTAANTITGNSGNNRLSGHGGNDTLNGGAGNDTLDGGTGNDVLNGGLGADRMVGGAGSDSYSVDNSGDRIVEGANQGTDLVRSTISFTLAANVENLTLLGTGGLTGTGNALGNLLVGNGGSNRLYGHGGNDTLNGGAGHDTLYGGAGNDQLNGGTGDDRLVGGAGADRLTGGAGADRFVFAALADSTTAFGGRDTITDFSRFQRDQIDLAALDANTRIAGNQSFRYIGEAAFSGKAGELAARAVSGGTLVSGDVNGDKIADFAILLDDRLALGADSFIL